MTPVSQHTTDPDAPAMSAAGGAGGENSPAGALPDLAVIQVDAAGRCRSWPLSAEEMTGFSPAEMLGRDAVEVLRLLGADAAFSGMIGPQACENSIAAETWCERKGGTRFPATVVFLPVAVVAGLPRGAVLVVRDRTREHVAEKKLALAAHASQAAEQAGAEALSRAAHQLRTPLAGMMLWTKLLEEQPAANAAQRREALQAIRSCVEEQMAIIDALSGRTGTAEQTRK